MAEGLRARIRGVAAFSMLFHSRRDRSEERAILVRTPLSGDEEVHSGRAWAQRVDDPWDPMILTLGTYRLGFFRVRRAWGANCDPDGGGIRGYSTLLIIERLMREISQWERKLEEEEGRVPGAPERNFDEQELLPCHYFDFMYGTSTGGLIATMLGRLRMSVPQCLEIYRDVGNDLFGKRRSRIPLSTKYHHKPLEEAVKKIVRTYCKVHGNGCGGEDLHPWHLEDAGVINHDEVTGVDRICQTYDHL